MLLWNTSFLTSHIIRRYTGITQSTCLEHLTVALLLTPKELVCVCFYPVLPAVHETLRTFGKSFKGTWWGVCEYEGVSMTV